MTTQYIDTHNPNITAAEAIALYKGTVKPYPHGWYDTEEEVLEYRAINLETEHQGFLELYKSDVSYYNARTKNGAVVARYQSKRERWAEFSMDVNKWSNLICNI